MSQVILQVPSAIGKENKSNLVAEIRKAILEVLEINEYIGQVVLHETPIEARYTHKNRGSRFIIVETMMYPGRSPELKTRLTERFVFLVNTYTDVVEKDINCIIHEISPENYFRGITHKYIEKLKA